MTDQRKKDLEDIIFHKRIKTVFQPIVSLTDGSVLGYEALSRIVGDSVIKNPEQLFTLASEYNCLWELELLCRSRALEAAYRFMVPPYNKNLFLNVNPNSLYDENFKAGFTKEILMQYYIKPSNVIFEITERNVISDMNAFLLTINHYRNQEYQIAIDDAGAGYSGLNLISDVHPNYIKLDMKLIRDIDTDRLKYALVKGMVELSKISNISLIAEGIETEKELLTLVNLGVQYGQGYFIQKPDLEINDIRKDLLDLLNGVQQGNEYKDKSIYEVMNKNLLSVDYKTPISKVIKILMEDKNKIQCDYIAVTESGHNIGMISMKELLEKN